MQKIETLYKQWLENATEDKDLIEDLKSMKDDKSQTEEAFYRNLEFGTAGLRGVLGAGTNKMNIYTVGRASQGLANYIINTFPEEERSVAISFDSRIKSDLFAETAAAVFAANSIKVHIYRQLMPVPCLSFAVRELHCAAGIMITASHNPAKYNGYKVYGKDGCQITSQAADAILKEIEQLDPFCDVKKMDFDKGMETGVIEYIGQDVEDRFIQRVKGESMLTPEDDVPKDVAIIYSPLNGSGLVPVMRTLKETGYTNITVVEEQRYPDGNFPTCSYPNPEIRETMALGIEYAKRNHADILLATDPDCDRVGTAVKDSQGEFVLLSGNQIGVLLLDYICAMAVKNGKMPEDPVLIKTIVSTDMADKVAASYGVRTINVLTGFKYIGEQIAILEASGKEDSYMFGFEESYGYLSGTYVRDKDGVDASFLICEMFAYYKSIGKTLLQRLEEIYDALGYTINTVYSFTFEGLEGVRRMDAIMSGFRDGVKSFGDIEVAETIDYSSGIDGLPKADVVKFVLQGGSSIIVRPSGTEPKIKVYLSVCEKDEKSTKQLERYLADTIKDILK